MTTERNPSIVGREDGFSLVEAMIAVLVFIIGIAAVSNLFLVAATANSAANTSSATAALASEVMDRLRAIPAADLVVGGVVVVPGLKPGGTFPLTPSSSDTCVEVGAFPPGALANCVQPNSFRMVRMVPGVGVVHVNWQITAVGTAMYFITVRAQTPTTVVGERSYAEFTTIRSIL